MGVATLISETFFCSHYTSLWKSLTPSMEDCVRRYNLSEYERIWVPLPSGTEASRRGFINEAAFIFYCENHGVSRVKIAAEREILLNDAFAQSATFLKIDSDNADSGEKREALAIAGRLDTFFSSFQSGRGKIEVSPTFYGCGIVGRCRGDVIKGTSLFEVKAGDRKFRSIDFRQLLVYASLRYATDRFVFKNIGIVNPRTGIFICVDTATFCRDAAGLDPFELFERILSALTASLVSD